MDARLIAFVLLAAAAPHAAALNKCVDGAGRVTYTSLTCEKEGLQSAGAIKGNFTVLPTANTPAAPKQDAAPKKKQQDDAERPLPTVKPVNPLVQQLLK